MAFNPWEMFLLLFATIGPLRVTIVCATMTAQATPDFLQKVAYRAVIIALAVCIVFAVVGEAILNLFSVSIPAFQIGGGIIVLLFSLEMAAGNKSRPQEGSGTAADIDQTLSVDSVASTLAVPFMASVSGLVAIISLLPHDKDVRAVLLLCLFIVAIMALNYVCLRYCGLIVKTLGPTALGVIGKILGVILTALAVELVLKGLNGLGLIATLR